MSVKHKISLSKVNQVKTRASVFFGDTSSSDIVSSMAWLAAVHTRQNIKNKDVVIVDLTGNITKWLYGEHKYDGSKYSLSNCPLKKFSPRLSDLFVLLTGRCTSSDKSYSEIAPQSSLSIIVSKLIKSKYQMRSGVFDKLISTLYDPGSVAIIDAGNGQTRNGPIYHKNVQNILVCENTDRSLGSLEYLSSKADQIIAVTDNYDFILEIENKMGYQVSAIIPKEILPKKRVNQDDQACPDFSWFYKNDIAIRGAMLGDIILKEVNYSNWSEIISDSSYTEGNYCWDNNMETLLSYTEEIQDSDAGRHRPYVRCAGTTQKETRCSNMVPNYSFNAAGVQLYNTGPHLCHHHLGQLSEEWTI